MLPIESVDTATGQAARGLRLVVLPKAPTPWSEAAKALFVHGRVPFLTVVFRRRDTALAAWTHASNAPVALYEDEAPRSGWREILELAERLAPSVPFRPQTTAARTDMETLAHDVCGVGGLGWCRRLQLIHAGLTSAGELGFDESTARYLGDKYGYRPEDAEQNDARVREVMEGLDRRLSEFGAPFFYGEAPLALDFYVAAFLAMFDPLPESIFPTYDTLRKAFEYSAPGVEKAWVNRLAEHRERIRQGLLTQTRMGITTAV